MARKITFGQFFKKMRAKNGLSSQRFCLEKNIAPRNISKLERKSIPPPQSKEKREQYASFLQIEKGSDDWYEFSGLAAAESGRIPADILSDVRPVKRLLLVFRTIRGQKIYKQELEKLAEGIRKS